MECSNCKHPLNGNENNCPNCGIALNYNYYNNMPMQTPNLNNNQINNQFPQNIQNQTVNHQKIIIILLVILLILLSATAAVVGNNKLKVRERVNNGTRTIMIYMAGNDLESMHKIASADINSIDPNEIDLDKVNVILYTGGTKKWHNFVDNTENAIYELTEDGFKKVKSFNKKNMGSSKTLTEFLNYTYENYETNYYDIVFYDHGAGVAGAVFDEYLNDGLSLIDFRTALEDSIFNTDNKLNTVTFRTCLNGTLEIANVFAPYADYLIASEEVTNGHSTTSVLNYINEIDNVSNDIEYGKAFIEAYGKQIDEIDPYRRQTVPMYAIIDLSKIQKINDLLGEFISGIDLNKDYNSIMRIRKDLYQYGYSYAGDPSYDQIDLYTLVDKLGKYSKKNNKDLLNSINDAVIYNWSNVEKNSNGLAIYFPCRADSKTQSYFLTNYNDFGSKNYFNFIKSFHNKQNSHENFSSFSQSNIQFNKTTMAAGEFTLQLTEEQANDYAEALYIVFEKQEDTGLYQIVYSSDNTEITSDGVLKTNIANNLIEVVDKEDPDGGGLMIAIERNNDGYKQLSGTGIAQFSKGNSRYWRMDGIQMIFNDNGTDTYDVSYTLRVEKSDDLFATSGVTLDPLDYTSITIISSHYKIFDENGNYIIDLDNGGIIRGYEIKSDKIEFKKATLDPSKEYYCVFRVEDIYGNSFYSQVLKMN